jgi:hypothetical protein
MPLDQAITQIGELGLRHVLKDFRKSHVPQKRSLLAKQRA